ncbi:MAG: hydroxyacid dehydrogenase [Nitrososphaerota archaeon]
MLQNFGGCVTFQVKILVTDPLHEDALNLLHNYPNISVDYFPEISREKLLEIIHEYDAMIVRDRTKITCEILDKASKLKIIVRAGSGLDNIDVEHALKKDIKVFNTPDAVSDSVAELTIGLMIMLSRKLYQAVDSLKKGLWLKNNLMGFELSGKTVGIIGVGRIGSRVAKIAKALNMKILLYDIVKVSEDLVREVGGVQVDLETLLRESDYVTLHVPLTPETEKMIGERELKIMKKTAFLINTARGKIVDSEALYKALIERWIAGVALDVYEVEPPLNLKLLQLDNVVCTPHIGAQTIEARRKASILAVKTLLENLLTGR